jgi:hypothetical protein
MNGISNSCRTKRGCEITLLPSDKEIKPLKGKRKKIVSFTYDTKKIFVYGKAA